jgi:hypothetical protein
MNRQSLLLCCFLSVALLGFVHTNVTSADQHASPVAQVSPLISPLSTTVQTQPISVTSPSVPLIGASGSPVSLVLVGAVMVGLLVVIGLVLWRQR